MKQTVHLVQRRYQLSPHRRPWIWVHAMRYNRDGSAVVRTGSVEIRWLASPPLDPWRTIVCLAMVGGAGFSSSRRDVSLRFLLVHLRSVIRDSPISVARREPIVSATFTAPRSNRDSGITSPSFPRVQHRGCELKFVSVFAPVPGIKFSFQRSPWWLPSN